MVQPIVDEGAVAAGALIGAAVNGVTVGTDVGAKGRPHPGQVGAASEMSREQSGHLMRGMVSWAEVLTRSSTRNRGTANPAG